MPHGFIDNPVCSNRIIGLYDLADIFHPEAAIDIVAKTKEFYSLFYGKDLTDAEVKGILHMD
jgi:iron complex transport system substrate-binding protein